MFLCVLGAALLALRLGAILPQHHRSPETKDTVKLTMGLVGTMTGLVLGMLVASAKGSYDTQKGEVTAMSSKIAFLDRLLEVYGPEAAAARQSLHRAGTQWIARLWPETATQAAPMNPTSASAEGTFEAIQALAPVNDEQRGIKSQALGVAYDIGQMRWLLFEQADTSISPAMLRIVVCWLAILFFSFGPFAPRNATVISALTVAAFSVAAALFLILELDHPFGGLIKISSRSMINALNHAGN